ncbi:MAG: gliding motility-associated C-terminal domain-containing protein [Sporocytophaga sp.]|uniref:glycosyl hydrolase family 8 n=1 Tax=Sporocytophaga sp. TaxID=2231183 RepID=UPI001B1DF939|nr:glycosyl hydrolase family 8 [Sporocytophaga sp.]MBO9703522.1 gliding motility-associated C-terminal domain-containing protein [Sporocytophaga sp.]
MGSQFNVLDYLISTFFLFLVISKPVNAQTWPGDTIHVNINTNNPAFPFPQFLEYKGGKSLAANNAVGVTHADMEKAMREAYQIMMRRALTVPGKTLGTGANATPYIVFNHPSVPQGYGTFVSEGDGYAMLAAAHFADKKTFDGLWLWVHDNRLSGVKKYYDCSPLRPTYTYGAGFAGWECDENTNISSTNINSAADGDLDIAMALLMAHKQWGDNMGITDACGNQISYKGEALKMIKLLVDTLYYSTSPLGAEAGMKGYLSGIVGIDGYLKSGNTWGELTNWRTSANNTVYPWAKVKPDPIQVTSKYVDYNAPAYFREFAKFLEANGGTAWQISQCKRCEASGDWTIKAMYDNGHIASAGDYKVSDDGLTTEFGPFAAGEDFRCSWRTILNYVWHGNPDSTWNPGTHQVEPGGNTYEYDMALRHKEFLKFPGTIPSSSASAFCSKLGASPDPGQPNWKGVAQIKQQYRPEGTVLANYGVNWMAGTGTPAAVASGDLDLTAELYRQCELAWDDQSGSAKLPPYERYIGSTPKYFHGFFRILGMLTASGNLHSPEDMKAGANVKVYMDVDKTFAYEGDLLNYEVSYRNYGAIDATGVVITTTLDPNYEVVSVSGGGTASGATITWNIGTVPGFKTGALEQTKGVRKFVVRVRPIDMATTVCLTSTITASNAPSWTSNEYPNNATYTMERNCVDLLKDRVLAIKKTTDRSVMNPGDVVNFTLDFENKTGSNLWLNGGRPRVVVSYANYAQASGFAERSFYQFYRIWHTAHEAYINLGNYRVSYFMNDGAAIGEYNAATNPTGWTAEVDNQNDLQKYGYNPPSDPMKFIYQKIPWGQDAKGAWNQRIVTQFANVLTATTMHVYDKLDSEYLIHKGVVGPSIIRTVLKSNPSSLLMPRLVDDWSYDPNISTTDQDGQEDSYFPVNPGFTNFYSVPKYEPEVVDNYSKDACGGPVKNFSKVLVEEFDGYTWRRVAGDGPLPGRETYNVVVTDSIPIELEWSAFTDDLAVDVKATYTPLPGNSKFSGYVKWTIPVMLTGEKANLSYRTIAKSPCSEKTFINAGWIWSDVDSPDSSAVILKLTCLPVPPTPPKETSLVKTANTASAVVGDVINYTLTFTNKDGSTASWAGASTQLTDWQTLGTGVSMPKLNGTVISLDQNGGNNPPGTNGYAFGPKKAHGVNGWVEATIAPTNSSSFSLLYRYQSGTPGLADFKGLRLEISPNIGGNNFIEIKLYQNGSNTPITSFSGLTFPGSFSSVKVRTELLDDKLYIWINDFTGAPLKVITGITELGAGYAGIYGKGSQQALSGYTAHFDSAFDLVITDPIPAQLNNITNISNSGVLTGSTITWPTVAGPILANAVIERTFDATVNTCTDFITNIGKATVYGVTNIQSQYVVNCGAINTCIPPTKVTTSVSKPDICLGAALNIAGAATPANANYYYTWYKDGIAVTTASNTYSPYTKAVTTMADTGTYVLRVEDGNAGAAACYKESAKLVIRITAPPLAGTISSDQNLCAGFTPTALTGTASTEGATVKNYKWQSSTTNGTTGPWTDLGLYSTTATGYVPGILTTTTYYRRIDSSGYCSSVPTTSIAITVTPTTVAGTISSNQSICSGESPDALTGTVSTGGVANKYYKWQTSTTNGTTGPWTDLVPYSTTAKDYAPVASTATTYYRRVDSSGYCLGVPTASVTITVTPTVSASVVISTPSITTCANTAVTFTAAETNGGSPTYQWYKGAVGSGTAIPSATGATYTTPAIGAGSVSDGDSYYVVMTSSLACAKPNPIVSNAIVMTVTNVVAPVVTVTPDPGNIICENTSITFTAIAGNGGSLPTYEWFVQKTTDLIPVSQGPASSAVDSDKFTINTLADGDKVTVKMVSNSDCASPSDATSEEIVMTVKPNVIPTVTVTADKSSICPDETVTFTAVADNGGTPTYEWKDGTTTVSTSGATYTTNSLVAGNSITVTMTSTELCASPTFDVSVPVSVTIKPIPAPAVSITADIPDVCEGNTVNFTSTPTDGGSNPIYQWYIGTTKQGVAGTSNTFTTSDLTVATSSPGNTVKVELVSDAECASDMPVASNVITIAVKPGINPGKITDNQIICYNTSASKLTETAASDAISAVYSWQQTETPAVEASWVPATGILSNDGKDFTPTATLTTTTYYRRRVDDATAPVPCNKAFTTPVKITVTPVLVAGEIDGSQAICSGNAPDPFTSVNLPTGGAGSYAYQWQYTDATHLTMTDIDNATDATYAPGVLTSTTQFQRIETSGNCGSVTSNVITVTVASPEVITASINDPGQVCSGSAAFNFIANSSTTGSGTLSYKWYLGSGITPVSTSSTYSYSPVSDDNDKTVKVVVSTSNTCNAGDATSNIVTLNIVDAEPAAVSIEVNPNPSCVGMLTTFNVKYSSGTGSSPIYNWYVNTPGVSVGTGTTFSSSTLVTGDQVWVGMTSNLACVTGPSYVESSKITMNIQPIPNPVINEGEQIVCSPNKVTFTTTVNAGSTYQWMLDGSVISGATNPSYTASESGLYTVIEDNGSCSQISAGTKLTVIQTPVAYAGEDIFIKDGEPGQLLGAGGILYNWSPATGLSDAHVNNPTFIADQTIVYKLTVADANNICKSQDSVTVYVERPIRIPNAITVNGDGKNDTWEIENIESFPNAEFLIYNRWGNLVWKSTGYLKEWDGTNYKNGEVLPDGTYFYIINLNSQIYNEPYNGYVQVIK